MHISAIQLLEALPTRKRSVINQLLLSMSIDELRELVAYFNGHNKYGADDTARIALLCVYSGHLSNKFPPFSFVQSHLASCCPDIIELKPRHVLTRPLSDMTGHPVDYLDGAVFQSLIELMPNGWLVAIPVRKGFKTNIVSFPDSSGSSFKGDSHAISQ
ncbi:hypothetical protein [Pseudomonas luteola]|uniref:Uncharacterized protein n=1 Tax=Pseudomonas luteola TaxID=47886 RepID=A0ABS0FU87_PSELU|nr:hypothetical protein [Pseudomonas zeshuii]MBF8643844.1 hypothetical protein [Pseudomonas zeshuii]